jgi:hypothetical protein
MAKFDPKNIKVNIVGLLTGASLEAESVALAGAVKEMDNRVQLYLVSELVHMEIHRNATRLNRFFSALKGTGYRVSAMHAFIQTFGNVRIDKDPKKHPKEGNQDAWVETYVMRPIRSKWAYYDGKAKAMVAVKSFQELIDVANKDGGFLKFRPEPGVRDFIFKDTMAAFIKNTVTRMSKAFPNGAPDDVAAALAHLDKAAIALGIKGSDITPTNVTIPKDIRETLHLVVDNTVKPQAEEQQAPAPAARRGRRAG